MRGTGPSPRGRTRSWIIGLLSLSLLVIGVAPVLAIRVPTDPEPDIACHPDAGTGMLTQYATTVETPADSTNWFVSVEFTIAGDGASCELSLASYELPSGEFSYPQSLYAADTGTFGPGTHVLTAVLPLEADLPGCYSQYDFVFGAAIEELSFENRYGDRQIRARIVGSAECPSQQLVSSPPSPSEGEQGGNPTPSEAAAIPSASERGGELGGNPTPAPASGDLPDTSLPATGSGTLAAALSLLMIASLSVAVTWRFVGARSRR